MMAHTAKVFDAATNCLPTHLTPEAAIHCKTQILILYRTITTSAALQISAKHPEFNTMPLPCSLG